MANKSKIIVDTSAQVWIATQDYYVKVSPNIAHAKDGPTAGFAGITNKTDWNFQVGTAPIVEEFYPLTPGNGAIYNRSGPFILKLDKPLFDNATEPSRQCLFRDFDSLTTVSWIDMDQGHGTGFSDSYYIDGQYAIFYPDTYTLYFKYYIELYNSVFVDSDGLDFASLTGRNTWNFQVTTKPSTTPIANDYIDWANCYPAPMSVGIPTAFTLDIAWDSILNTNTHPSDNKDTINPSGGNIAIVNFDTGATAATVAINHSMTHSGKVMSGAISGLTAATKYYITIPEKTLTDGTNAHSGRGGDASDTGKRWWTFTTA